MRSKPSDEERETIKPVTKPGECVSVDMMTSPTPGLVAQMSGNLHAKDTSMQQSMWIKPQDWVSHGYKNQLTLKILWRANWLLSGFANHMEY